MLNAASVWSNFQHDLRYAWRGILRRPIANSVALFTLVVGIGAVTAVISIVDSFYFRPLPYSKASKTVALSMVQRGRAEAFSSVPRGLVPLLASLSPFEEVTAFRTISSTGVVEATPLSLTVTEIDSAFAHVTDLRPSRGRWPTKDEFRNDAVSVAVISDNLFRIQLGSRADVLGSTLWIDSRAHTIVGIVGGRAQLPDRTDLWIPARASAAREKQSEQWEVLAALKNGTDMRAVRAALLAINPSVLDHSYADATIVARDEMIDRGTQGKGFIGLVFAALAAFVLLIAAFNVGALLLIRAGQRQGEMAVRGALGATRRRLVQQVMTESLVLTTIAAVLGVVAANIGIWILVRSIHAVALPSWLYFGLSPRVLIGSMVITLGVTLVAGLLPAKAGIERRLIGTANASSFSVTIGGGVTRLARRALIAQVGLAFALSVAATATVVSYRRMVAIDPGYPADEIELIQLSFAA